MKCRAKIIGEDEVVKGYHFELKDKHYIILDTAEIGNYGVDGEMLYGFVEVDPETIKQEQESRSKINETP